MNMWAIVFGATGGVGSATCRKLNKELNLNMVLIGRNTTILNELKAELESTGTCQVIVSNFDLRDDKTHIAAMNNISKQIKQKGGKVAVMVYAAGVFGITHTAMSHAEPNSALPKVFSNYDSIFDVNVNACYRSVAHFLPSLIESGEFLKKNIAGKIHSSTLVLVGSMAAKDSHANIGCGVTSSSKSALTPYSMSLANEVKHHNLSVTCMLPALINTKIGHQTAAMLKNSPEDEAKLMKTVLQPEDVADGICYIAASSSTVRPVEIMMDHNALLNPFLDAYVEKPTKFATKYPVTRPNDYVCFITGASKGIGRGVAIGMAKLGYNMAIAARSLSLLEELAVEMKQINPSIKVKCIAADISNVENLENAIHEAAHTFGTISCLINCAGINRRKSTLTSNREVWDQTFDLNFRAAVHGTRVASAYIAQSKVKEGGSIIFISSAIIQGFGVVGGGLASYYATKYGLLGFDTVAWEDLRYLNIKVSTIAPGLTKTALGEKKGPIQLLKPDEMIQVEDVADAVSYVVQSRKGICPRRMILEPLALPFNGRRGKLADQMLAQQQSAYPQSKL